MCENRLAKLCCVGEHDRSPRALPGAENVGSRFLSLRNFMRNVLAHAGRQGRRVVAAERLMEMEVAGRWCSAPHAASPSSIATR